MVVVRTVKQVSFNLIVKGLALSQDVLSVKDKKIVEHVRIVPSTQIARHMGQSVKLKHACIHRRCYQMVLVRIVKLVSFNL